MEFERTSMAQFSEISRLIQLGLTDRKIARALKCRRTLASSIREGVLTPETIVEAKKFKKNVVPDWALGLDWKNIEQDLRDGHQIKRIWEDRASAVTSHPNFFKYIKTRFAQLLSKSVTLREFKPGEYCEVDYAGDRIEWIDRNSGEIHDAHVFVGILCFSQKMFAMAAEDEKKHNWLYCHRRMFEFYGGCAQVLVPDQLKNGVIKSHRYDPDLNPDYVELANHYGVAVVPARVRRPKDKALVENAVGIIMRYFKYTYRRHTFYSIAEINSALTAIVDRINKKTHTRFKTSRQSRFETLEKPALLTLPLEPYSISTWKRAIHHPDCTVAVEKNYYSAPHIYRGKELRIKISEHYVEIFFDLDRIAVHPNVRGRIGEKVIDLAHLPENARAYREVTPQRILSEARYYHTDLHALISELFESDTLGNLRRAEGFLKQAARTIKAHDRSIAEPVLSAAIAQMKRFGRIRVKVFEEFIKMELKKTNKIPEIDRTIVRRQGNPMVRGNGRRVPNEGSSVLPEQQITFCLVQNN